MNSWVILGIAIVLEVIGTTMMKLSEGFTKWLPSVGIFVCYGLAFAALTLTLKKLDVSVVYAIWSGAGVVLISFVGALFFKEPMNALKMFYIGLIVMGVIGLSLHGDGGH